MAESRAGTINFATDLQADGTEDGSLSTNGRSFGNEEDLGEGASEILLARG